jgi:gliding motility-associated-like protein
MTLNLLKAFGRTLLLSIAFTFIAQQDAKAQEFDGKDFWLAYLTTFADPNQKFQLNIISDTAATVTIEIPLAATPYTFTVQLTPNVLYTHTLPSGRVTNNGQSHQIRNTGVHVTATSDIIVYIGNNQDYSSDAATAIPTSALGNQYDVIAYSALTLTRSSTFNIIATQDTTTIDITYNGWTALNNGNRKYNKGQSETITLHKGQVYVVIAYTGIPITPPEDINNISSDLTGTTIRTDKPVSVFGGNECAYAGECPFCDHLFEQVRPLKSWGYRYNIGTTYKLPVISTDIVRLYATENGTTINISGQLPVTLNAKQYHQIEISSPISVESNKPIHVSQYLKGSTCNTPAGEIDPLMMDVIPENQYSSKFLFGTSSFARYSRHYATIFVETGQEGSLRLNGSAVAYLAPGPIAVGASNYSMAHVSLIGNKSYTLESLTGANMSVYAYGYGVEEAYGYTAGGKIIDLCYVQTEDTTVCYGEQASIHGLNINSQTGLEVSNNNILWFANPTGGASLYSGKDVTTAPITTDSIILWAQVDNATCANSRYPILIIGHPEVVASIQQNTIICAGDSVQLLFDLSGKSSSFDVVYSDGASNFNLNNVDSGWVVYHTPSGTSTFSLVSAIDDTIPGCGARLDIPSATITVSSSPQATNLVRTCNGAQTDYTVEFDVINGDQATYTVSGLSGTFGASGTHFTSVLLPSGSSYSFDLFDNTGCDTMTITGSFACNCFSVPGAMTNTTTTQKYCEGDMAIGVHDGNHLLQPEDKLMFYLHSGNGAFLSAAIDSSASPQFGYAPGMTYGTTYYISPVVGDSTTSGFIDRSDACFFVGQGTPVVFYTIPVSQISGSSSICSGATTNLLFNITGTGPFNVQYTDGSTNYTLANINNGHNETVSPTATTSYTLVSVMANNGANCLATMSGSATITVAPTPTFDLSGIQAVCAGSTIALPLLINGTGPFNLTYKSNNITKTVNGFNTGDNVLVTPIGQTVYTPISIIDLASGCVGTVSGTFIVQIIDMPIVQNVAEDCNGDGTYKVEFDIGGGSGNYFVVSGVGTLLGGNFVSDDIISGIPYNFLVFDDVKCDTIVIAGTYDCCSLSPGNMNTSQLMEACDGEVITTVHDGGQIIGAGEVLQFMVYSDVNDPVGSQILLSNIPTVTFNAGSMSYETIYYIRAVASTQDGQGNVDFASPCFEMSTNYIELIFHENPVALISGGGEVCRGDSSQIQFDVTIGSGPWDITYTNGGTTYNAYNVTSPFNTSVAPTSTSSYTVVSVTDLGNTCVGIGNGVAVVSLTNPTADFLSDIQTVDQLSTFIDNSQSAGSIEWKMPDGKNYLNDSILKFSFQDLGAGAYTICLIASAEDVANCYDTTCRDINVEGVLNVFIPNSFTPDGNEYNNMFTPVVDGGGIEDYTMLIYDRWGGLVYETNDLEEGWNGSFNNTGDTLPVGTYTYKVEVKRGSDPNKKAFTGHVTLLN